MVLKFFVGIFFELSLRSLLPQVILILKFSNYIFVYQTNFLISSLSKLQSETSEGKKRQNFPENKSVKEFSP